MKKIFKLLACLSLAVHLNACTSNDSRDESEDGSVAEDSLETGGGDAALEASDSGSSDQAVAENNDGFLDEQLPEDALGESTPDQEVAQAEPPPAVEEAPAVTETPSSDPAVVASEPPPVVEETPAAPTVVEETNKDSFAAVDTGSSSTMPESTPDSSSVASVASTNTEMPSEEKPKTASLKKIEVAPFKRSGILLNAVYIARPGDSFSSISKNIYGSESKTKELKKVNPYFSKVRPGDKVYYNSPVRPTDDTKLLTHYEDSGLIPETYVAKEGDDLKKVSKELLGYDNAWKEIWVTNSVDSKGALSAGTELRYWKSTPVAMAPAPTEAPVMPEMANNTPPPAMNEPVPPPMAANEFAAPPAPDMNATPPPAMNEPVPPPPPQAAQDLPPPPPAEAVNPPPPPVVAKKAPQEENIGGLDNDMIMTLGGAGILVAAIALLMIVRKRRQQKEMSAAFGDTHVGT